MKDFVKNIIVTAPILSLIVGCADYKLQMNQSVEKASAKGEFCSLPAVDDSTTVNIIFVVDMSGSNIRKLNSNNSGYIPEGTDSTGQRFEIIEEFLQSDCAKENTKNRFSIVGFSANALTSQGQNCSASLLSLGGSANLNGQLDYLRNLQKTELEDIDNPDAMKTTYYEEGLNCAQTIISEDLASKTSAEKKKTAFHVMFLSDGLPIDSNGKPMDEVTPILSAIDGIVDLGRSAAYVAVQPILYGASALGSSLGRATEIMRQMAERGTTQEESVENPEAINFCSLLNSKKRTPFTVTDFGIVNLTAHLRGGKLLADSDMDGILDIEEANRGFDPQKARSMVNGNEILDGLCKTDAESCSKYVDCGTPNEMGLTKCDAEFLNLTDGLDSDGDGIPDLVEFHKGSLANTFDTNTDLDGDGVINSLEILKGSDPNTWDNSLDSQLKLDYRHYLTPTQSPVCPSEQQSWAFQIDYVPVVETLATNNTDPITSKVESLQHGENENVILVYYIIRQSNETSSGSGELYGQFIKLKAFQKVNLKEFKKLGVINGRFEAL